jgi:hypothetical protein
MDIAENEELDSTISSCCQEKGEACGGPHCPLRSVYDSLCSPNSPASQAPQFEQGIESPEVTTLMYVLYLRGLLQVAIVLDNVKGWLIHTQLP